MKKLMVRYNNNKVELKDSSNTFFTAIILDIYNLRNKKTLVVYLNDTIGLTRISNSWTYFYK